MNVLEILKNVALFDGVKDECLHKIEASTKIIKYSSGETIIEDGAEGNSLFILIKGEVKIIKPLTAYQGEGELNKALIRMTAENKPFFGEMAILGDQYKRSAAVIAETDCKMIEIEGHALMKPLEEKPELCAKFYKNLSIILADRLRKANNDILKLTTALSLALDD